MGKKSNDDVPSLFIGSSVIPIINKLQDIFSSLSNDIGDHRLTGLRLPQVVVVGSQSSGKSSVLEALVGRDFLPRGSDICTRRPLLLQLEKCPKGIGDNNDDCLEWGEFGHFPEKRFYDFSAIRREILDINKNRPITEALAYEDQFFRDHHVYRGLSDRCGIPLLAKKLNQILEQHIRNVLPTLKTDLTSHLVAVEKELHAYGEALDSKGEKGAMLLNILTKYSEAFSAEVDGNTQAMTTKELSGGARIHHVFQSIFGKSLEDVDPCEDLSDEDIRIAIHNATGPRNALFVPEVPFEVLVRRQIARLLDPSIQCLRFVYDELIKISRACEAVELRRFSELRRRLEDVTARFLRDGVKPAERMITNLIEMEMDYINSSHPNFIGGTKAVDTAQLELKAMQAGRPQSDNDKAAPAGTSSTRTWGVPAVASLFASRGSSVGNSSKRHAAEVVHDFDQAPPVIQLKNPPLVLRPGETDTEYQVEIIVTKLLITSYYDIVRRNIQDLVPKAIMHYLVNHAKRNLLGTFIEKLYRENLFEDLLREQDEVVTQRRMTAEMCHALRQAVETLDEFVADVSTPSSSDSMDSLPKLSHRSSNSHSKSSGLNSR
ncbi:dynamin-related protein 3A-like isoform X5 [Lycium barbarum]|uniref:dynamin-related protein 3A-like isoform X5 n=1 Tax=Lycium barbarum TaxID=112863 RepID=UPI00293E76BD|nr:dynamin-related protein 3A-like isoform X5 [Lycium barbarum]